VTVNEECPVIPIPVNPEHHITSAAPADSGKSYGSYPEVLQEIRVAQGLAQALVAFQLSLGFTNRFSTLMHSQRVLYVASLVLSLTGIALLVTPIVFRKIMSGHERHNKSGSAGIYMLAGLGMLMCSTIGSLLFALYVVFDFQLAFTIAFAIFIWFVMWWFVYPIWMKIRHVQASIGAVERGEQR
jgi:hypothetical protein